MPEITPQKTGKPEVSPVPVVKRGDGVRTLRDLNDLRRLQARLIRQFLSGSMTESDFRALTYACGQMAGIMKALQPANGLADVVTNVVIGPFDEETTKFIAQMNANIMAAPEENADV